MSEKSEEPTPKKQRDAKKKGEVAKSQDLTTAVLFVVAFNLLLATGGRIMDGLQNLMKQYFEMAANPDILPGAYNMHYQNLIFTMLGLIIPLLGANFVMAIGISAVQVGILFTMDPLKPELKKLNPLSKMKQWVSPQNMIELLKITIKFSAVFFLTYGVVKDSLGLLVRTVGSDLSVQGDVLHGMVKTFTMRAAVVFILIAAADFGIQKKMHAKKQKMSKDEVKREHKEDEGDPHVKHQRKHMMHELVFNSQMSNVKKATVIVVNPTQIAVALMYDKEKGGAPEVLAKGERLIADQIRQLAKEYGIPILRNVSLAQALNRLDVGDFVPEELYEAVAEVLNFVYKMGQHKR